MWVAKRKSTRKRIPWISVLLDGSVPLPEIRELLDRSYELAE